MKSVRHGTLSPGLVVLTLMVSLCAASAARADIIIDDFTSVGVFDHWPTAQTTTGNVLITEIGLPDVLGGVRLTTLFGQSFASGSDVITANVDTAFGRMNYSSTDGADGALSLIYTGFPSDLGADFTSELGILVDFDDFGGIGRGNGDDINAPVTVDIYDGENRATLSQAITFAGAQTLFFDFTQFVGIESLDLSSISRITVAIDPGTDIDFKLDLISTSTIPAPGALALLGIAGLMGRRRRRSV